MEVYKNIEGWEGKYQISNLGNVKSMNFNHTKKEGLIKGRVDRYGYHRLCLYSNGKRKYMFVHRLVAQAFIPNPENKETVNHKDGVKLNNHEDNLEWATWKENTVHAVETGLRVAVGGLKHHTVKPFNMYDKNGKFIRSFERIKEAVDYLGTVKKSAISMALRGANKTAGGYIWKYK